MKRVCVLAAAALALAIFADAAQAQRRGRGGFGGSLIGIEQVRKELKVTDDQQSKLAEIQKQQRSAMQDLFSGLRDLPREERRAKFTELRGKMEEMSKKFTAQTNEVLSSDQKKRLQEITIQVRGSSALSSADVAKALGLSDDQKEKLTAINADYRDKSRELFQGGNREEAREKFAALRKETGEKLLAVLNADQKEKFEKMQGEKFELDRSALRRGGGQNRSRRPDA